MTTARASHRFSRRVALGGALALPLALAACGATKTTKTNVLLDWVPNTNHTGLYVAQDRGYFEQRGLAVDILPFPEGGSVEQLVGTGKATFGISSSEPVTKARAEGIPVVSIAAIIQHDTSGFASLKTAKIARPRDFEGKRYASFGSPTERPLIAKLMAADGGDVNKVQFIETGDSDFLTLAQQGRVDFAWIFEGVEKVDGEVRGMQLDYIPLTAWQKVVPDYYTPVFITSEAMIAKQPDVVRNFLAAVSRGYGDAITDPTGTTEIIAKAAPEANKEYLRRSQQFQSAHYRADAARWGEQRQEVWQQFIGFMTEQKLIEKPVDAAGAFTAKFLP